MHVENFLTITLWKSGTQHSPFLFFLMLAWQWCINAHGNEFHCFGRFLILCLVWQCATCCMYMYMYMRGARMISWIHIFNLWKIVQKTNLLKAFHSAIPSHILIISQAIKRALIFFILGRPTYSVLTSPTFHCASINTFSSTGEAEDAINEYTSRSC